MFIVASATDIRTWIVNNNPCGIMERASADEIGLYVEEIRQADDRPAWGADWSEWLDDNAESIIARQG